MSAGLAGWQSSVRDNDMAEQSRNQTKQQDTKNTIGMGLLGAFYGMRETIGKFYDSAGAGISNTLGFGEGGFFEKAGNFFEQDKYGNRWNWENNETRALRYELQDAVNSNPARNGLADGGANGNMYAYHMLKASLVKRSADALGIPLNSYVVNVSDDLVNQFLKSRIDPKNSDAPFLSKMQAILNYTDGSGEYDRKTMVSGVTYNLNEKNQNYSTNLSSIAKAEARLYANTALAANEVNINSMTVSSIYRGASGSHDGHSMDITYVTYTDANGQSQSALYKRAYDPVTQTFSTPVQPEIFRKLEASFILQPGSEGILSPWTRQFLPGNRSDSLLNTYGWMGDRKPLPNGSYYGSTDWSNNPNSGDNYDKLIKLHPVLTRSLDDAQQHYHHGHFQVLR
jgi:hypothetical protein